MNSNRNKATAAGNGTAPHDDLSRLVDDIGRYFDCSMTDAEEADLRRRLAASTAIHPAIDEARAIMGLRRGRRQRIAPRRYLRAAAGIAAACAVAVSLGAMLLRHQSPDTQEFCMAYVNGIAITAEEDVLRLTMGNLCGIATPDEMDTPPAIDLDDLSGAIDRYDNDPLFID